jgi:SAM-dependent methyltransferase
MPWSASSRTDSSDLPPAEPASSERGAHGAHGAHALRAAHDDWDAHWEHYAVAAEYNPAQRYRRSLTLHLLERRDRPRRLIDIGSGQGDFLLAAAQRWPDAQLVGLEASARGNEIARGKVPAGRFVDADLMDPAPVAELAGWATHAVCSEVLEHVDDPATLLRNARAYLGPGARIVVTVPGGPVSKFDLSIGHRRHYTPQSLRETFAAAGLCTTLTMGAGFPFFNLYRRFVIVRGERLADDISTGVGRPSRAARAAMLAFWDLLPLSLPRSPWGTQIVGVAHEPRRTRLCHHLRST